MKKVLLALCAVLLVACTDKNEFGDFFSGNNVLRARIENVEETESRVAINGNSVSWEEGDCIGVYGNITPNVPFEYQNGQEDVAEFTGNLNFQKESVVAAYYPYQEDAELSNNELKIHLPAEYTYKGNSNAPMLGYRQESGTFVFKHLTGLMRITLGDLPEGAERFVISSCGEDALAIAGEAVVEDVSADNAVLVMNGGQTGKSVTYHLDELATNDGLRHFFVPLPVGNYQKIEVALYGEDSETPYFTRSVSNIRVERADMIEMPIINGTTGDNYVLDESVGELSDEVAVSVTLSDTDNSVLIYGSDVPAESIPAVGQIIVSKAHDNLPDGFLGRVTKVEVDGEGNNIVYTEMPALTEVFDKLYIDEIIPVTFQSGENHVKSRGILQDGIFKDMTMENELEISMNEENVAFEGNFEHTGNLILNIQFDKENKLNYCAFTWKSDMKMSGELKAFFEAESKREYKQKIIELTAIPIPLAGGLIRLYPVYSPSIVLESEAEIKISMGIEGEFQAISTALYKDGTWEQGKNASKPKANHESPLHFQAGTEFSGEMFFGISNDFSLRLYNKEDMRIYINPKVGFELQGEIGLAGQFGEELNLEAVEKAKLEVGLYLLGVVGADASLLSPDDVKAELELVRYPFWKKELSAIPGMKELSSDVYAANASYTSDVKTEMKGEVLSKDMKVELVVVDKDGNEVATSQPVSYNGGKTHEEDPDVVVPLENTFENLLADADYSVFPRVTSPLFEGIAEGGVVDLKNDAVSFSTYNSIRDVLVKIYNDCGGKDWEHQGNWCTDAPVSEWEGVFYDSDTDVYYWAFLQDNKLTGTFSIEGCDEKVEGYLSGGDLEHIYIKNCPNFSIFSALSETKLRSVYLENVRFADRRIWIDDNPLLEKIEIYNCDYIGEERPGISVGNNPLLKALSWNGKRVMFYISNSSIENVSFVFEDKGPIFFSENHIAIYDGCKISKMSVDGTCDLGFYCSDLEINELVLTNGVNFSNFGEEVQNKKIPYFYAEHCSLDYSFVRKIDDIDIIELSLPYCDIRNDELVFSNCSNIKRINLQGIDMPGTVDIRNTPNLQSFSCDDSNIKELLFDEHINEVEASCSDCRYLSQEFPAFFTNKYGFHHDERYDYIESVYDPSIGDWIGTKYVDNGYGWWYPGEPQSGYHGWK